MEEKEKDILETTEEYKIEAATTEEVNLETQIVEEQRKKSKKKLLIGLSFAVILFSIIIYIFILSPMLKYNKAESYLKEKKYLEASKIYQELGDYKDSKKQSEICKEKQILKEAEETVINMLESFKKLDFKKAEKYVDVSSFVNFIDNDIGYMSGVQFINEWFDTLNYKVVSKEKVDDKTVKIHTKIASRNLAEVFDKQTALLNEYFYQNIYAFRYMSKEQRMSIIGDKAKEYFIDAVSEDGYYTTVTNSVTINVKKEKGKWIVNADWELINAVIGDLEEALNSMGIEMVRK